MDRTAIILADGFSSRLGQDKGLLKLMNKPLVRHVLDAINPIVNEKIVIVSSSAQVESYSKVLDSKTIVFTDFKEDKQSPLLGALTGFTKASGKYSVLLSCDFPLVSRDVVSLLFELSANKNAVIPRWPNCCVEPLHAIYCTKAAQEAARKAVDEGKLNMQAMIDKLRFVRYISTLVLQQLDPELRTFLNINTLMDLKRAEKMLKTRPH